MTSIERYQHAHKTDFATRYPAAYKDGHYSKPKIPVINSTNGLTTFIINFINWSGGFAERTGVEGRTITKKGFVSADGRVCADKPIRIKNSGKGRTDIGFIWHGRACRIEVKFEGTGDTFKERVNGKQSKQAEYRDKVTAAGAIHGIARSVDGFLLWWDTVIMTLPKTVLF